MNPENFKPIKRQERKMSQEYDPITMFPIENVKTHFETIKHEIDENTQTIITELYQDPYLAQTEKNNLDLNLLKLRKQVHTIINNTIEPYLIVGEETISYENLLEVSKTSLQAIAEKIQNMKNMTYNENINNIYNDLMERYVAYYGKNIILTFGGSLIMWSSQIATDELDMKLKKLEETAEQWRNIDPNQNP